MTEEEMKGGSWGEELLWGILEQSQTRNRGERDEQIGQCRAESAQGEHPRLIPGDTVRVHVRIKESETKERLQAFEGVVIARKGFGVSETITVRKTSFGIGVERIFPLNATIIDHIDVVKRGRVRRAKLYYLRALRGKAARIRERDTRVQGAAGKGAKSSA